MSEIKWFQPLDRLSYSLSSFNLSFIAFFSFLYFLFDFYLKPV